VRHWVVLSGETIIFSSATQTRRAAIMTQLSFRLF
jgi:hypothetical protein